MSGFYSYDAWKTTPPPDESDDLSLCSKCGEWSEWEDSQCPRCGYGEPPPTYCQRCNSHHARDGEAEERCQEVSRFVIADHRRRGGEG